MYNLLLTGWFIIKFHDVEASEHRYLVEDPVRNYKVSFNTSDMLPYEENTWVKLQMTVSCEEISESYVAEGVSQTFTKRAFICSASKVKELKCTERNSMIINGIKFC